MQFRHVRNEENMNTDELPHNDNDLQCAIEKFVYNTLIARHLGANALPGLSLKSDNQNDPLHEHFVQGFSAGLQKFLVDDENGKDLCRSLSPKGILQNIGLTEVWHQVKDPFRDMLQESALHAAEKAIQQLKSMATISEIKYALKQTISKFRRSLETGNLTFGHILESVKIELKDKQITIDLFWVACRETNIPVPSQNFEVPVCVPDGFFREAGEVKDPPSKIKIIKIMQTGKQSVAFQNINSSRSTDQKPPWYKTVWAIIGGIIILLGCLYTLIQIRESDTFKHFVASWTKSQATSDPNAQTDSNATIQPSNPINDTSKSLPDSNSQPPPQ